MHPKDLEVRALDRIKNKYLLTLLVSKRVKQLERGSKPLIEGSYPQPIDIALREVAAGKITYTKPAPVEPIEVEVEVEVQSESIEQETSPEAVEQEAPAPIEQEPAGQSEAQ